MRRKINKKPILRPDTVFEDWTLLHVFTDQHAWDNGLLSLGVTHARPGETLKDILAREDRPANRLFAIAPHS